MMVPATPARPKLHALTTLLAILESPAGPALALLLRAAIIALSFLASPPPPNVSMTDIDYLVLRDGVCSENVFQRATYRYSPLMRHIFLHAAWCRWPWVGKAVLAVSDYLCGWLISSMGGRRVFWDWNPYVIAMSCRGSFDSVAMLLVLLDLKCVSLCRAGLAPRPLVLAAAAAAHGLAVHLRIWPVILSFRLWAELGVARGAAFGAGSFAVFAACAAVSEYTDPGYIQNGILYHISGRVDHRHNLSALWPCMLELRKGALSRVSIGLLRGVAAVAKGLQLAAIAAPTSVAWIRTLRGRRASPRSLFQDCAAMAAGFVALNSVATTQYFLWFLAPLLVALGGRGAPRASAWELGRALARAFLPFAISLALWMLGGYLLEFRDVDSSALLAASSAALTLSYAPVIALAYSSPPGEPAPAAGAEK